MKDCNLHENQRKSGVLCRSMHCTKCPPYREKGIHIKSEKGRQENVDALQSDLWAWSKKNGVLLEGDSLAMFIQGWKAAKGISE